MGGEKKKFRFPLGTSDGFHGHRSASAGSAQDIQASAGSDQYDMSVIFGSAPVDLHGVLLTARLHPPVNFDSQPQV